MQSSQCSTTPIHGVSGVKARLVVIVLCFIQWLSLNLQCNSVQQYCHFQLHADYHQALTGDFK